MCSKVSSSSRPKQGQRHQNRYAFKLREPSKKIQMMPVRGLCTPCEQKILWRKQFGKFKPLTSPRKWYDLDGINGHSVKCSQKAVKNPYHVICKACAHADKCCEKCLTLLPFQEQKDVFSISILNQNASDQDLDLSCDFEVGLCSSVDSQTYFSSDSDFET